ncbi:type II secretion system F family protein [Pelagibacterium montanilacus]|uniref:type II secretion system F family protein n=1 Tax=Pelagibacterium montanilacus TaxID=2185280 RepID=UPI000F8DB0B0|nr:type II secretion system F family protein [Pelagibacterium montanilacus]
MSLVDRIAQIDFLIAVLAAISAAAIVFTFGAHMAERIERKGRMRKVALERENLRTQEMSRLRASAQAKSGERDRSPIRGTGTKSYMKSVVERFSLQKAFVDSNTVEKLARAGLRGQGPLTTFLFFRFASPIALFLLAALYLVVLAPDGRPLYLNVAYSVGIGILGAYLPLLMLKNSTLKRQKSIRDAWSDALDLMLLCVEAGMSIEHAIKRVAREIGVESPALAEELTLTTAELSFLEDRTRAFENLGRRTGLDVVRSVMTALVQADRYGTSVGQALRVMAEEGREARMMEAEKKAAALPPKMTVPLIVFFLPVLFIVIMAPAIITATSL